MTDTATKPTEAWDVTTDPANPVPLVWPECPTCSAPYVWRRGFSFVDNLKAKWAWMKDCKHTPRESPVLMTADGPYDELADPA